MLALVEQVTGRNWSHAELQRDVDALAAELAGVPRSLLFCRCRLDAATVIGYLAARQAGHVVAMVDDAGPTEALEARYGPALVLRGDAVERRPGAPAHELHPDLSLLLPTSGTTGSPKLVRLSETNLCANAAAIVDYLGIDAERAGDRLAALSLLLRPVRAQQPPARRRRGRDPRRRAHPAGVLGVFDAYGCTSFAGVPYSYALLERTGWERRALPTLRTMTQAGGRLDPEAQRRMHATSASAAARFVVMYGQTEATARIAWVPPERLAEKAGSIGIPIPGGHLSVEAGEIVYKART